MTWPKLFLVTSVGLSVFIKQRAFSNSPRPGARAVPLERLTHAGSSPSAILVGGPDHLEEVSATLGEASASTLLERFEHVLHAGVRNTDVVMKLAPEEGYALLLRNASMVEAAAVAHRLRDSFSLAIDTDMAACIPCSSVSFGLADSSFSADAREVLKFAHAAWLEAKATGTGVLIADALTPEVSDPGRHANQRGDRQL